MKLGFFGFVLWALLFSSWLTGSTVWAATASPALLKAKQEAEAKGYLFITSHDEIVAMAKKEGRIRVLTGLESDNIKPMAEAFKKKYPFLDFHVEEIAGTESYQRFILELKAGRSPGWDSTFIAIDFYNDYAPFQKKFDVLGMASQKVLNIPPQMVDPFNRNIVSPTSIVQSVAFNKKTLPADKVPEKWTDFLKPEFKGKKFMADFRPIAIAALVPAWGLEKTLDFSRKLAAQQPLWVRGATRPMSGIVTGESALFFGPNSSSVKRAQTKDPTGSLGLKIPEPVPVRYFSGPMEFYKPPNILMPLFCGWNFKLLPTGRKSSTNLRLTRPRCLRLVPPRSRKSKGKSSRRWTGTISRRCRTTRRRSPKLWAFLRLR